MERVFYIFTMMFLLANVAAAIHILKKYGSSVDLNLILKAHYEISIYALKCGAIGVVVDWISKDWFKKK